MHTGSQDKNARVAVLGLGYVGCVTAAGLAKLGHQVIGVDRDPRKVHEILQGRAPFYEPELEPMVQETVASGRLRATESLSDCLESCDIALICVGTPSERNGNIGLSQLRRVSEELGSLLPQRSRPLTVVIRSTVFPGTCEQVVQPALGDQAVQVVSNPEFLREGCAVHDFFHPGLIVVGGENPRAVGQVAALYGALDIDPLLVTLRAAEMIKYACNCFHAVKISFANEIGTLCTELDIDGDEVMKMICSDAHLNISPAYLRPGFAFGGSCLPKDLRALAYRAARLDVSLPMLQNVLASNQAHLKRAMDAALSLAGDRIGIFGLAFKDDTDDLRESPVVALVEYLIGKGRDLRIFDPHIQIEKIYGQNQQFALNAVPHIGRLMSPTMEQMLESVDHVIVTQRPKSEWQKKLDESGKPMLCLYGISRQERLNGLRSSFISPAQELTHLATRLSESQALETEARLQ